MKKFPVFILLLLSSFSQNAHACWYYPTGDEVRFCFFNSFTGHYPQYSMFNYTSSAFADSPPSSYRSLSGEDPNIALWVKYCNNKVSVESAEEAVYTLGASNINEDSHNTMVRYLYSVKDFEALEYLKFAKAVEDFNEYYENPWERDEDIVGPKRKGKIAVAVSKAQKAKNPAIKSRYYFLAIRMAFYNKDFAASKKIYEDYFEGKKHNDIIDYWSLYFRIAGEKDTALQSYYAAMVFAKAPDKRFQVFYYFDRELPLAKVLKYAKNKEEAAAIYEMYSIRKIDHALEGLEGIYKNDSGSDALGFLLMREMNKLEDWIYTPYYSYFSPMMYEDYETQQTAKLLMERVADDRQYAARVLEFVNSVNLNKVSDPEIFKAAKAYLLFMVKDYNSCLAYITKLNKEVKADKEFAHQMLLIRSLCLTASQPQGSAIILESVKQVLMDELQSGNEKFVFAIGRELEYLGNMTDAALIYSRINGDVSWRAKDLRSPYYDDYYSYYFDYMDGAYSPAAVKELIADLNGSRDTDAFSLWLYKEMNDLNLLYDLLGTKYIRINRLNDALAAFDKMAPDSRASGYLDDNPFYEIKYTPDFTQRKDSIQLTKADITRHLIKYIAKGADPKEKDRDYYNFLAGNCYYNMTQNGNTWYMRRYTWSSSELTSSLPDEEDFHDCNYAKYYYMKAFSSAKTKKFKALCLRYAANCERMKIMYRYYNETTEEQRGDINKLLYSNIYYKKLKKKYPSYCRDFDDSSCMHYSEYFKARR